MNGAAEAILEELLQSSIAQQAILQRLAASFSSTSASAPSAGLAGMGRAATAASVAITVLQKGFDMLSGLVSSLGSLLGQTIGHFVTLGSNLYDFAKQAAYGTAQLSGFIDVFRDLPLVGKAFQLLSGVMKYQEELLGVYRNLSNSGATFGGSLVSMNHAANQAYMTLGEFSKVVTNNSDLFAGLGAGLVDKGIVAFVDANSKLMGPDSEYSQSILGLGVSAEQASEFLTTTMRSQGFKDKQATATSDQLAKYTNEYVKTLDEMSRLTGIRRDQLDAEVKKAEQDQLWQTFTDGLDSASAAAAQNMIAMAAPFGTAAVEEVKNRLRGLDTPISEAGTNLAIMSGGASLAGEGLRKALNGTAEDQKSAMNKYLGGVATASGAMVKAVGTTGQAAGVLGNMLSPEFQKVARMMQAGGLTFEEAMKKASEAQAAAAKGPAAALAKAQQDVKIFGSHMNDIFMKLISPITGPLIALSGGLMKSVDNFISSDGFNKAIEEVTKIMDNVIKWMGSAFESISKAFGKDHNWKAAIEETFRQVGQGFSNVWEYLEPGFKLVWQSMKPVIVNMFKEIFGAMKDVLIGPEITKENQSGFERQNEINKSVMSAGERTSTFFAEFLEGALGLVNSDLAKRVAAGRIQSDTEAGIKDKRLTAGADGKTDVGSAVAKTRHSGTIGMTGNWWEKSDATLNVQAGESVVTQAQMDQIVNTASQSGMAQSIQQLNSLTAQMLSVMKQTAENTKRTYDATRALNGDLFQVA